MIYGSQYQNAYVTPNITEAVKAFSESAKPRDVIVFESTTEVDAPQGSMALTNKIAMLWVGDTQYEFIEPVVDPNGIYKPALDSGALLTFHHHASRVDDWDTFRKQVDQGPFPVAFGRETGDLKFLYLDARDVVGHYLEYVSTTDERWRQLGWRN